MKKKLPDFLIVGAAKSGTTSLHNYLNQHPDIFMPTFNADGVNVKEPQFFVKQKVINKIHFGIWDWGEYKDLFKQAQNHQIIGEASVFYLYYYEEAIKNIKRYLNSEIKIIIILRNPVDRAFSAYTHVSRNLKENNSFEESLAIEGGRMEREEGLTPMVMYKGMGLYYKMVNAFFESFNNVHIILYDDFLENTESELKKVFGFLNLNRNPVIDYETKYNVGGLRWKTPVIKKLLLNNSVIKINVNKYISQKNIKYIWRFISYVFKSKSVEMNSSTKEDLIRFYEQDIIKLSKLINRDLSLWLR
tara:strand:+ start:547 stop:1455 length:909 start_codon:yes stop_codon:yes gene_type:complete